jgi:hypothetical protein
MVSARFNNLIQSITSIAIVVGLVLVILELQQNHESVMSQLSSDGFAQVNQTSSAMLGERPAEVIAKSCISPLDLTVADLVVLDNYYGGLIDRTYRMKFLSERGSFYTEEDWRSMRGGWGFLFETAAGRAYWKTFPRGDTGMKELGDAILIERREAGSVDCEVLFDAWKKQIVEEVNG